MFYEIIKLIKIAVTNLLSTASTSVFDPPFQRNHMIISIFYLVDVDKGMGRESIRIITEQKQRINTIVYWHKYMRWISICATYFGQFQFRFSLNKYKRITLGDGWTTKQLSTTNGYGEIYRMSMDERSEDITNQSQKRHKSGISII